MKRIRIAVLLLSAWAAMHLVGAQVTHPWEMVEMTFEAGREYSNSYVDGLPDRGVPLAQVTLTGTSEPASGLRYTLALFWDGGKTWKARFAPPTEGEWTWSTTSNDPGLNAAAGKISVVEWTEVEKQANPARRGFVRVSRNEQRPGRYFEYTDGTPFLWIGDTWWNWTKRGIQFSSFQKLADDRSTKGFTVGQLFFAGNNGLLSRTYDSPNLEQVRKVEEMIAYANSKGITVWIHPWWSREHLNERLSEEQMRRWWRYVIARLAAYNVIWVLAGDCGQVRHVMRGGIGASWHAIETPIPVVNGRSHGGSGWGGYPPGFDTGTLLGGLTSRSREIHG